MGGQFLVNAASKLAWVGCLLSAAACTSTLDGRRYACIPDAGDSADQPQCPGNYRCGAEKFCHQRGDTTVAWICAVDTDCEGGWKCGLADSRTFRECHEPTSKTPAFACAADTDCVQQWKCGLEGICHSPKREAAYLCRSDAGLSDKWCEQGWRCTPEGLCTNPKDDALRELSLPAFPTGTQINPAPSIGPISSFSVSQVYLAGVGASLQTVAYVQDGGLNAFVIDRTGAFPPQRFAVPGGAPLTFAAHGTRGEFQVGTLSPVAGPETQVFVASAAGALSSVVLEPDGGTTFRTMSASFPVRRLTQGTAGTGLTPRIVGFDPDPDGGFLVASGPTSSSEGTYFGFPGVDFIAHPNNRILDMASMRGGLYRDVVFAIEERGLWMLDRRGGGECFNPTTLPPLTRPYCSAPQPVTQGLAQVGHEGRHDQPGQRHFRRQKGREGRNHDHRHGKAHGSLDEAREQSDRHRGPESRDGHACDDQIHPVLPRLA